MFNRFLSIMNCFRKPQNADFRGLFPSKWNKTTNNTFDRFLIMNCFRKLQSVHFKTPKHTGVCFSFSDPSHLLRSFLFIKDVYLTFLECISFLLVSKYIYNLLRICMFPSQIIRRMSLQFICISFTIYEKDVASLYVHFKSDCTFNFQLEIPKIVDLASL